MGFAAEFGDLLDEPAPTKKASGFAAEFGDLLEEPSPQAERIPGFDEPMAPPPAGGELVGTFRPEPAPGVGASASVGELPLEARGEVKHGILSGAAKRGYHMLDSLFGAPARALGGLAADMPMLPPEPTTSDNVLPAGIASVFTSPGAAAVHQAAGDPDVREGLATGGEAWGTLALLNQLSPLTNALIGGGIAGKGTGDAAQAWVAGDDEATGGALFDAGLGALAAKHSVARAEPVRVPREAPAAAPKLEPDLGPVLSGKEMDVLIGYRLQPNKPTDFTEIADIAPDFEAWQRQRPSEYDAARGSVKVETKDPAKAEKAARRKERKAPIDLGYGGPTGTIRTKAPWIDPSTGEAIPELIGRDPTPDLFPAAVRAEPTYELTPGSRNLKPDQMRDLTFTLEEKKLAGGESVPVYGKAPSYDIQPGRVGAPAVEATPEPVKAPAKAGEPAVPDGTILEQVNLDDIAPLKGEKLKGRLDRFRAAIGMGQFPEQIFSRERTGAAARASVGQIARNELLNRYAQKAFGMDYEALKAWEDALPAEAHQGSRAALHGTELTPAEAAVAATPEGRRMIEGRRKLYAEAKALKKAGGLGENSRVIEGDYHPSEGNLTARARSGDADALRLLSDQVEGRARSTRKTQGSFDKRRQDWDKIHTDNSWRTGGSEYIRQLVDEQVTNRAVIEPLRQLSKEMLAEKNGPGAELIDNYIRNNVKGEPSLIDKDVQQIMLDQLAAGEKPAVGMKFKSNGKMGRPGEYEVRRATGEVDAEGQPTYEVAVDGVAVPETYSDLDLLAIKHADQYLTKKPVMHAINNYKRAASFMTVWGNTRSVPKAGAENLGRVSAGVGFTNAAAEIPRLIDAHLGRAPELVRELKEVGYWSPESADLPSIASKVEKLGYIGVKAADQIAGPVAYLARKAKLKADNPTWPELKLRHEAKIDAAQMVDISEAPFKSQLEFTPEGSVATMFLNPASRKWQQAEMYARAGEWTKLGKMFGIPAAALAGLYGAVGGDWRRAKDVLLDAPIVSVMTEGVNKPGHILTTWGGNVKRLAEKELLEGGSTSAEKRAAIPFEAGKIAYDVLGGSPGRLVTTSVKPPERTDDDRDILKERRRRKKEESYLDEKRRRR